MLHPSRSAQHQHHVLCGLATSESRPEPHWESFRCLWEDFTQCSKILSWNLCFCGWKWMLWWCRSFLGHNQKWPGSVYFLVICCSLTVTGPRKNFPTGTTWLYWLEEPDGDIFKAVLFSNTLKMLLMSCCRFKSLPTCLRPERLSGGKPSSTLLSALLRRFLLDLNYITLHRCCLNRF